MTAAVAGCAVAADERALTSTGQPLQRGVERQQRAFMRAGPRPARRICSRRPRAIKEKTHGL
jgi:hypothetical protein